MSRTGSASLLELCDVRIRKVKAERILEALRGNYLGLGPCAVTTCDATALRFAGVRLLTARLPSLGRPLLRDERRTRTPDPSIVASSGRKIRRTAAACGGNAATRLRCIVPSIVTPGTHLGKYTTAHGQAPGVGGCRGLESLDQVS
jgi:hypothetical protein